MNKKLLKSTKKLLSNFEVLDNIQDALTEYNHFQIMEEIKGKVKVAIPYLLKYYYNKAINNDERAVSNISLISDFVEKYIANQNSGTKDSSIPSGVALESIDEFD